MGSMECKVLIGDLESERHPDLAIYLSPPPPIEEQRLLVELGPRDRDRDCVPQLEEA